MAIWAIADIHASQRDPGTGAASKPMDIFGPQWAEHVDRLEKAWMEEVQPGDTVIIAGDTDWALHLEDALETLERIDSWQGKKILIRGNHDYWWSSKVTGKVRKRLPPTLHALHNDSLVVEGFNICGTKGSPVPGAIDWTPQDEKILHRESQRLLLSLSTRRPDLPTIVALHYPPIYGDDGGSPFREILEDNAGVEMCVYGHLHGDAAGSGPEGELNGIQYRLVAADYLDFQPLLLARNGTSRTGKERTMLSHGTGS